MKYSCCFSLYRGEGILLGFFSSIIIQFGLFTRFFNALLNASAFICRLLDYVSNYICLYFELELLNYLALRSFCVLRHLLC